MPGGHGGLRIVSGGALESREAGIRTKCGVSDGAESGVGRECRCDQSHLAAPFAVVVRVGRASIDRGRPDIRSVRGGNNFGGGRRWRGDLRGGPGRGEEGGCWLGGACFQDHFFTVMKVCSVYKGTSRERGTRYSARLVSERGMPGTSIGYVVSVPLSLRGARLQGTCRSATAG